MQNKKKLRGRDRAGIKRGINGSENDRMRGRDVKSVK